MLGVGASLLLDVCCWWGGMTAARPFKVAGVAGRSGACSGEVMMLGQGRTAV